MLLRSVLVLCTISLFGVCNTLIFVHGSDNPRHWNHDIYFDDLGVPRNYLLDDDPSETTTENQQKEYGNQYGQSIKKYFISQDAVTWFDARDACKAKGMVLTCPSTPVEDRNLLKYLRDHNIEPENRDSGYWIGSHISSPFSPWIWECNDQEVQDFGWFPGEPNLLEEEHCMEHRKMVYSGWNNIPCALPRKFICESLSKNGTQESEKNTIQDKKDTTHEELRKNADAEDNNSKFDEDIRSRIIFPGELHRKIDRTHPWRRPWSASTDNQMLKKIEQNQNYFDYFDDGLDTV